MSRRTQLTTKYLFQVLAQLSENFIFIYLGLSLFTETSLYFEPLFILVTVFGICVARWAAVFPLSRAINWFIRYRARRRGREVADELPYSYQAMLFWAGLRGAVGVALAAGLTGENRFVLRATVLVVVVLTVIIFGGTTARMLEILGIRTGVVEEMDSDDEFDIEEVGGATYYKRYGDGVGRGPLPHDRALALSPVDGPGNGQAAPDGVTYSSGNFNPPLRPEEGVSARKNSTRSLKGMDPSQRTLLGRGASGSASDEEDVGSDTSDLPPAARRSPRRLSPRPAEGASAASPHRAPTRATQPESHEGGMSARHALTQLLSSTADDQAAWFRELDEGFIKPKLLLDQSRGGPGGPGGHSGHGGG